MKDGDGPVRDEERGTRELPAENADNAVAPGGSRHLADGVDGIPEQARPHPEDDAAGAPEAPDGAAQGSPRQRRNGGTPGRAETRARQRATGGTMSEHERDDEQGVPATQHEAPVREPQDRSGARAMFVELRGLKEGSPEYAELRNKLVRMHLPLVEHLARRFRNRGEPLDDLTQVATIGLIKSVDRFDPDRGVEFSTYATPTVVGEIKRHFRDKGWAVRVPRRLQELRLALTTATAELSQQHGRSPTVHELAEKLAISEEEVLEGLESANAYSTLSLDVPDTDDESPAVADTLGAEDEALEGVEYRESLKPLLEDLPPREKRILLLRFFGNMTQSQIAQEVGISQMHVSRLLARTLAQLREKLLVEE
ncbi:RNA polymerase sigma factor SigF [Streptomyces sp. GXMU-J15]|uniref:RNA polymerase sigma factor SigF n=1 Tax=Streptomyces fuscus TaxID=3048495 RepID=A0ABT7J5B0_9ACTN|nr:MULTISPECIES: RNA polymerase sigma factor SigF [Streptomyces]MCM1973845.1 RNA polymerase sigma factor SigF [Streptomyces sp. G1]MDL2079955.1 RNA polymerase sigma factor SigF [Streptomyces fuscus]SBT91517.1 RNA polymerase, sigma 28 subunit, SigD/FliA/WhiG [Streptomyces sp. DI166]